MVRLPVKRPPAASPFPIGHLLILDDNAEAPSGTVLFGGVDSTKYQGSLIALPIIPNPLLPQLPLYAVQLTEITAQSPDGRISFTSSKWGQSNPIYAVLDSGTTNTRLPADVVLAIQSYLGATPDPIPGRPSYSAVACDLATSETVFTFTFGGSQGPRINVPISDFISPREPFLENITFTDGTPACALDIEASPTYTNILGDSFLRSAYIVYDIDNRQIALAQSNLASTAESDIQDILPGVNGIPGVSGIPGVQALLPALPWNIAALRAESVDNPFFPTNTATAASPAETTDAAQLLSLNPSLTSVSISHIRGSVTAMGSAGALWSGPGLPVVLSGVLGVPARTGTNAVPTATGPGAESATLFPLRRRMPSEISPPIDSVTSSAVLGGKVKRVALGSVILGACTLVLF